MSTGDMITISRDGQQYGPYTVEQINGYLTAGNLLPTDLAWNGLTAAWVPLTSLPGIRYIAHRRRYRANATSPSSF
jgi:hypothetical protein